MSLEEMRESMRRAAADGMVKIGIPHIDSNVREWCWARPVSPTHAKLENVCIAGGVSYGDIVEFEEQTAADGGPHDVLKSFVRVVTRGSTQCGFVYANARESRAKSSEIACRLQGRWKRIHDVLMGLPESERPLSIEGLMPGFGVAAFPASVEPSRAEQLLAGCPSVLEQFC